MLGRWTLPASLDSTAFRDQVINLAAVAAWGDWHSAAEETDGHVTVRESADGESAERKDGAVRVLNVKATGRAESGGCAGDRRAGGASYPAWALAAAAVRAEAFTRTASADRAGTRERCSWRHRPAGVPVAVVAARGRSCDASAVSARALRVSQASLAISVVLLVLVYFWDLLSLRLQHQPAGAWITTEPPRRGSPICCPTARSG